MEAASSMLVKGHETTCHVVANRVLSIGPSGFEEVWSAGDGGTGGAEEAEQRKSRGELELVAASLGVRQTVAGF